MDMCGSVVQGQLEDIIEAEVEQQVRLQLEYHSTSLPLVSASSSDPNERTCPPVPPQLQESVAAQKRQLDEVQYSMRNSYVVHAIVILCNMLTEVFADREARRANGQLRSNNLQGPMLPLMHTDGNGTHSHPTFVRGIPPFSC